MQYPSLQNSILMIGSLQGFGLWEDISFTIGSESAFTPTKSSLHVGLLISLVISCFVDEALINVKGKAMKISQLGSAFVKPTPFAFV